MRRENLSISLTFTYFHFTFDMTCTPMRRSWQMKREKTTGILLSLVLILSYDCKKEATLPEVMTDRVFTTVSSAGSYIYKGEGKIISDGGSKITSNGICYSKFNETPEISDQQSPGESDDGKFTCTLSLSSGQYLYYLRAFAKNKAGISYGNTLTLHTYCASSVVEENFCNHIPEQVAPSNGATGLSSSVSLQWKWMANYAPQCCDVYLDTVDATTLVKGYVCGTGWTISDLKPKKTYYWKLVKHCCESIRVSSIRSFTTQ